MLLLEILWCLADLPFPTNFTHIEFSPEQMLNRLPRTAATAALATYTLSVDNWSGSDYLNLQFFLADFYKISPNLITAPIAYLYLDSYKHICCFGCHNRKES